MAEQWKTIVKGVRVKVHPTRKHGVNFDRYFSIRFSFNGKKISSGLGWASEGWNLEEAIKRKGELKEEAKQGKGIKTYRQKQIEADETRKKEEQLLKEQNKKKINLSDFFNNYYLGYVRQNKKENVVMSEEQLFRLWIKPVVGDKFLKDVSAFDIDRLKKKILDAGRAPRTCEYALCTLNQIFKYAENIGYFEGKPPTTKVRKIKYDNKRVRFLSIEEAHILLNFLKEKSQQVFEMALISLHCGLRAGEIFNLKWQDIDFEHGLITLLDTKNGKTRRVSMTDEVKKVLLEKEFRGKTDYIFMAKNGDKIKKISDSFRFWVEDLGLNKGVSDRRQRVTFHTLRHTFASWLVMEGINLYQVKELMGHSSITMTERYAHLAADKNKLAADTMSSIFKSLEFKQDNIIKIK